MSPPRNCPAPMVDTLAAFARWTYGRRVSADAHEQLRRALAEAADGGDDVTSIQEALQLARTCAAEITAHPERHDDIRRVAIGRLREWLARNPTASYARWVSNDRGVQAPGARAAAAARVPSSPGVAVPTEEPMLSYEQACAIAAERDEMTSSFTDQARMNHTNWMMQLRWNAHDHH